MRAVLCESFGPPEKLRLAEVAKLTAGKGELLIDVHACGLNFPDVLQIAGKYQFQPDFPFTPGAEISGVVAAIGEGVEGFSVGDRVMATVRIGGMAEQVTVRAELAQHIPDEMDMLSAAGFGMTYGTSYHALVQRAQLKAGQTLVVLGASGGVGTAAVQIGKALGARVIAAARGAEKLELAKSCGADELIDYGTQALKESIKDLTDGNGADVVYDPVGGDLCEQALRATAWGGRLLIVGFTSGSIPKIPMNLPLLKGCQIVGVFWGAFCQREPQIARQNSQELFELYRAGKVKPHIGSHFPLEEYAKALNCFIERKAMGKVILEIRPEA